MSDRIDPANVFRRLERLEHENILRDPPPRALNGGGGDGTSGGMDLITYRLNQSEKRAEAADARMARVEDKLNAIQTTLAGVSTRDNIRGWGLVLVAVIVRTGATMIAAGIGVGSLVLQSSSNQLAAFQSGLSTIQAIVSASQVGQKEPTATTPTAPLRPPTSSTR